MIRATTVENGAVRCHLDGIEADMRFVYCACAIAHFLDDWSALDKDLVTQYISSVQGYEGGMGMTSG